MKKSKRSILEVEDGNDVSHVSDTKVTLDKKDEGLEKEPKNKTETKTWAEIYGVTHGRKEVASVIPNMTQTYSVGVHVSKEEIIVDITRPTDKVRLPFEDGLDANDFYFSGKVILNYDKDKGERIYNYHSEFRPW